MAKQKKAKQAEKLEPWQEFLQELNPQALTCDGFHEAIIGYVERCGSPALVCYDAEKMVDVLAKQFLPDFQKKGVTKEDAWDSAVESAREFLEFNTWGAYVGEHTPMFFNRFPEGSEPPGLKPK